MPGWEIINYREQKALTDLIKKDGGVLFAHGFDQKRKKYHTREFEKLIAKKFKSRFSLAVSSGTAALKIALKSLGVKRGDEVITQAFNFIATVEAILDTGAKPIIVDIDNTLNMCPKDLKKKISKRTKVIIPVHMLGFPADLEKIIDISIKKGIKIISDNCESMGAKYKKKYINNFVDVEVFSLDFAKTITSGEGGLILTNNSKIAKFCRDYHDHGHENKILPRGRDTASIPGFNYRMTEMQAVIGKVQLQKFDYILRENKKRYKILEDKLAKFVKLRKIPFGTSSIHDTFIFEPKAIKLKKIIKLLNELKIGTKNLPDAIKWHCAYYWKHALDRKNVKNSKKAFQLLSKQIAIPILISKSRNDYKLISEKIIKILKN